jgi:hypothetical protein
MRRLFRLAALGPTLLIGATLAAAPQASAVTATTAAVSTALGAAVGTPPPPVDVQSWWPWNTYTTQRRALALTIIDGHATFEPFERRTVLVCSPNRSGHPQAWLACGQLARAGGNPAFITPAWGVACTREYDPVTVTANGVWDGRLIRYQQTFANSCTLGVATGAVYRY